MSDLVPNYSKMLASEVDVATPSGKGTQATDCYDLELFENHVDATKLVLLVTVIISFDFQDDNGNWTKDEKEKFMLGVKNDCSAAWTNKYAIERAGGAVRGPVITEDGEVRPLVGNLARVVISVEPNDDMHIVEHKHWRIYVYKGKAPKKGVYVERGIYSDGQWEKDGLQKAIPPRGTAPRETVVHEFGHLLGLADEYPWSDKGIQFYPNDTKSLMHVGDEIKPRHYVFFADWISRSLSRKFPGQCKPGEWKVRDMAGGKYDLSSTQI
jgi:hypothetical protein